MRGRVVFRWGLIAAILGIVLVLPAASGAETETPVAEELAGYQKEFGVSPVVAEEHLEVQHRGGTIVASLEIAEGDAYAGVWFDNKAGEFVIPLADPGSRGEVEAALATLDLNGAYRMVPVSYGWEELEEAQGEVNQQLYSMATKMLVQTSIDPRTNSVVIVQAQAANDAQRDKVEGLEDDGVEVREASVNRFAAEPAACSNVLRACTTPLRGGVQIVPEGIGGYCTAGFKAVGKTASARYMLTAGHCAAATPSATWIARSGGSEVWRQIGKATAYSFPGHDWSKINATGSFWDTSPWPTQVVLWGAEEERPIYNEAASFVGEAVCHSGVSSGTSLRHGLRNEQNDHLRLGRNRRTHDQSRRPELLHPRRRQRWARPCRQHRARPTLGRSEQSDDLPRRLRALPGDHRSHRLARRQRRAAVGTGQFMALRRNCG